MESNASRKWSRWSAQTLMTINNIAAGMRASAMYAVQSVDRIDNACHLFPCAVG